MNYHRGAVLVLCGLLVACAAGPDGTSPPKITTGPLSWKITQGIFSAHASARNALVCALDFPTHNPCCLIQFVTDAD